MKKAYYEKNTYLLEHEVNKTFEQVLVMSDDEFRQWCIDLRNIVVYCWDILGIPPRVGYNKDEMINQFQQMETFPVQKFIVKDELTGELDTIRNTHITGNAVNQFFPSMMQVRINYSEEDKGRSIYDFFADDSLLDRFITYAKRHFKRDSFYAYSVPLQVNDMRFGEDLPVAQDSIGWLHDFHECGYENRNVYSYWLAPSNDKEYTGYNEDLQNQKYLTLTKNQIKILKLADRYTSNVTDKSDIYQIRVFKLGQKLFPIGLKAWRVSFCQTPVNFPPLTAKFLYERYTNKFINEKQIIVWDPSAGWGGRLLGSLSVKDDRQILYLGNDPNTDHNIGDGLTKYHAIYDFYCSNVNKGGLFPTPHNEFKFWQLGSEVMQFDPDFQQYKEKISIIMTSPPYFSKEAYSEDATQSYKKFDTYASWRDGFLFETLKTAYYWLRPEGYLIWNVSDVKFGNNMFPLVQDSLDICKSLGFKYTETLKMSLAQAPGGNRLDTVTGKALAKYTWKTKDGITLKYEPILVHEKVSI